MGKIKSVREQVYEHIVHMIAMRQLNYGDKINISELQEKLGVSRPPINEALIELSANGILNNIPRKGFYVKDLTEKQKADITETIAVLDSYAIRRIIEYGDMDEETLKKMKVLVQQMEFSIAHRDHEDYYVQQEKFHQLYLDCSSNLCVSKTIQDLQKSAIRTTAFFEDPEELFAFFAEANKEHAEIVKCIEEKDAIGAEKVVKKHWTRNLNNLIMK